jgi:hypothetical protein
VKNAYQHMSDYQPLQHNKHVVISKYCRIPQGVISYEPLSRFLPSLVNATPSSFSSEMCRIVGVVWNYNQGNIAEN